MEICPELPAWVTCVIFSRSFSCINTGCYQVTTILCMNQQATEVCWFCHAEGIKDMNQRLIRQVGHVHHEHLQNSVGAKSGKQIEDMNQVCE